METTTPQIRRLIVGSGVALAFCGGGWLALGLQSPEGAANLNAHRFWACLLVTVTLMVAMGHATGWLLRAMPAHDGAERDRIYAEGYAAGVLAQPAGSVVEMARPPRRTR